MDNPTLHLMPAAFCMAFLAILFLQSGMDKVLHRADNLSWLSGHFAQSPLKGLVPQLLSILTALEVFSGLFSLMGLVFVFLGDLRPALFGALLSMASVLALFFGQRMAKDYAGAAALVPYGLFALVSYVVVWLTPVLGEIKF